MKGPQTRSSHPSVPRTIDLNLASSATLKAAGHRPILALRIVEYREARGAFQDVEQLRRVKGIGKKTFDRIRALVACDLVTEHATREEGGMNELTHQLDLILRGVVEVIQQSELESKVTRSIKEPDRCA